MKEKYRVAKTHRLQVISRKRATNYGALLREMTCKDKASYDCTPTLYHTYEWVMVRLSTSHITREKESRQTYEGEISYVWVSHDAQI